MLSIKNYKRHLFINQHDESLHSMYSSPSLIRSPYFPTNCGHIREVAFGERDKYMHWY